jgi:hypothetical protein
MTNFARPQRRRAARMTLRLPGDLDYELRQCAARRGVTTSDVARQAVLKEIRDDFNYRLGLEREAVT